MELKLRFGALAPSIEKQLEEQGLEDLDINKHQKIHNGIIMLYVYGYIPESTRKKLEMKLLDSIKKNIKPININ